MGIERIFLGLSAKSFVGVIKIAIWMSIEASIGISFFCQFFLFLKCFWTWSVNLATPNVFFSAVFSKSFAKSEDHSGMKCFFQKRFVFLLKVYGKVTKKFAFFVEKSMQVVQTAIYISRGAFRGFFLTKKLKVCCAKQFWTFGRKFRWGLSKLQS